MLSSDLFHLLVQILPLFIQAAMQLNTHVLINDPRRSVRAGHVNQGRRSGLSAYETTSMTAVAIIISSTVTEATKAPHS